MPQPVRLSLGARQLALADLPSPLELDELIPGTGPWEVELGFGKGRYLLRRALESSGSRFLGVEVVSKYSRMLAQRARRQGADNLAVLRAEALYLMSTSLPRAFASAVHVYFPDPWPKARHHKRRLFDPERIDLVLGLLRPGGELFFATDFLAYGERVKEILTAHPALDSRVVDGPWVDGARTNYEAKYMVEGRPILRLSATVDPRAVPPYFHPRGAAGILCSWAPRVED